ncbi:MAG: hypothetical protein D4R74_13665 [Betaproteobacteria bacterium]|nr:MAG: hypothetical protein D4R74_13665 [Betaproteobacteria bacterium]
MAEFAVVRLNLPPPHFAHSGIMTEVCETVHHGLRGLGHDSVLTENAVFADRINILFAGHLLPLFGDFSLPPATVFFNLEPIIPEMLARIPQYPDLLGHPNVLRVWDYDARNLPALAELGIRTAVHTPIGYAPEMTRIAKAAECDIDVLFYGILVERRLALKNALDRAGLKTEFASGIYGDERDALVARAKVVLNISQFEHSSRFDQVRLSYLLANRKCIVSEGGIDPMLEQDFAVAVTFAPYAELVNECVYLCAVTAERELMEQRGFEFFSRRLQSELLRGPVADLLRLRAL